MTATNLALKECCVIPYLAPPILTTSPVHQMLWECAKVDLSEPQEDEFGWLTLNETSGDVVQTRVETLDGSFYAV